MRRGAKLDREAFQEPRVELFVVGEDIGGLNSSAPLTVTILDQNDNPPVFSPSSFSVRLPENSPTGALVHWFVNKDLCIRAPGINMTSIKSTFTRWKSNILNPQLKVLLLPPPPWEVCLGLECQ